MLLLDGGLKLLLEEGLIFELNRRILHPFGYALSVIISEVNAEGDYSVEFGGVKATSDPEGLIFADEAFTEGAEKYQKFLFKLGNGILKRRQKLLGYTVQGATDATDVAAAQEVNKDLWAAAKTPLEAKLQQELRRIHAVIQGA